jgi:hypothetical protein
MKVPNLEMKSRELNAPVFSEIVTTRAEDKILANHDVAVETTAAPEKDETTEIAETLEITAAGTLATEITEIETTETLATETIEIETTEKLATEITEIEIAGTIAITATETLATTVIIAPATTETLATEITEIETTAITAIIAPATTETLAITAREDEVPEEMVAAMKAEKVGLPANDRATEIAIIKDVVLAGEEEALPTFRIF